MSDSRSSENRSSDSRPFKEVFPSFESPAGMDYALSRTRVLKVVLKKNSDELVVHIRGKYLLSKRQVNRIAYELKQQLFKKSRIFVRIVDSYDLPGTYSPEQILEDYRESILLEAGDKGHVEQNLISRADWEADEDMIRITLEDSFLARSREKWVRDYFQELMKDRFLREVHVEIGYRTTEDDRLTRARDHRLGLEVDQIMDQIRETESSSEDARGEDSEKKAGPKSGGYRGNYYEERARQKAFRRTAGRKDPDVIYGRDVSGEPVPLEEVTDEIGQIVVRGQILKIDLREIKRERTIVSFHLTDFTDSIIGKLFIGNDKLPDLLDRFREKDFYQIKGAPRMDDFEGDLTLTSITGIKPIGDFRTRRMDKSLDKRVELHLHTVMSDLDSVVDIEKMIGRAKEWGHKAIAITDHGVLQAFPIADHCLKKDDPFKIIYGVEGYFVNDLARMVQNPDGRTLMDDCVVFDLETTGFSALQDEIIEIGAVKISEGKVADRYSAFVNPGRPLPYRITELTGIDDSMLKDAGPIEKILPEFLDFCRGCSLAAHNAEFDVGFIEAKAARMGIPVSFTVLDTVQMARLLLTSLNKFKLNTVCRHLGIRQEHHHRAVDDARVTAEIYLRFVDMLAEKNVYTLEELNELGRVSPDLIRKAPAWHGIILVRNETGRVNLNRLVSASHLEYFNRRPRMPMSLIQKYREGLILGSACESGELFSALVRGKSDRELAEIAGFYDFLEIQPIGNNRFMIDSDRYPARDEEDLKDYNRKILSLGEQLGKPVAATGDVHFLDPEDELYRRILMAGQGFSDADHQAPLYLRTTEEMLEEFSYLGEQKARQVVIDNTNRIADMIEKISPVYPDKCPPVIPRSDETLTGICYDKAHEISGEKLPAIVEERLQRELNSIISNGFAVMYIIAQKLVWDSVDHGYLVGSRGSVGSSFVATMSGITEVNPLPAHYICPECHFTDFDSEYVKPYTKKGMSGCDMPNRDCPVCGCRLKKEGHDIPFETFLGFQGNKEPDIDLNFSGEYQAKAHRYVEEIFGQGKAFRAGTIGTLAEKTAFGFVRNYYEERNIRKRNCEIDRIAEGCTGVKRTTGQHPGGIIVVPHEHEIYDFTAIQHPANDVSTDIITTHFEYHSIDHNLLKLDILGHDDPTMIKRLEDITGVKATEIPLDDQEVMELFKDVRVLGIRPEDIGGVQTGSLGVPEFGTDFVIQMLVDAKPQCFSDLVRISGLSHGNDVWLGNAKTLIEEGKAEISTAICCRDDIMTYLINMGLEQEKSFSIMESVRRGKGLTPDWEKEMLAHDVPDWYIWSCKKIKYMFPKAHAAAYVMMGWRVAWFKVHFPLAYYAAFFGIRASAFSYETMCQGPEKLAAELARLQALPKDKQTKKDQDSIRDGKLVQEMYARGFEFLPIDIYRAKARECLIIDGRIMPPLSSVEGLGDKACEQVEEAAAKGPFSSLSNFRDRTKVSKTVSEKMADLGILKDLPENDQLTIDYYMSQFHN